jgi:hypothetical protein
MLLNRMNHMSSIDIEEPNTYLEHSGMVGTTALAKLTVPEHITENTKRSR